MKISNIEKFTYPYDFSLITDEVWKQVVYLSKEIPGYQVSNYGRIFSTKTNRILVLRERKRVESGDYTSVGLSIPKRFFAHKEKSHLRVAVHRLVIDAFKPCDEYPPIPEWHLLCEESKKKVLSGFTVDHINNNPFDNHIRNLRRVSPLENNSHYKDWQISQGLLATNDSYKKQEKLSLLPFMS